MSPPRLLLLLLLGARLLGAARGDTAQPGSAPQPAPALPAASSGRFVSPGRHACRWQLLLPAPGAAGDSALALRCRDAGGARHRCAYRGEPRRCAAYGAGRPRFWKQVLGALRRKRRPCRDPAPLRARLCAGRKGRGAELRLAPHASAPPGPTVAGSPGAPRPRSRARSRPPAPPPSSLAEAGKRKAANDAVEDRPLGTGPSPDDSDADAGLTETYCAEKWHSVCTFLVNFWNG
ncbi:fibroblast growth factor-binding protein 3 [Ctenodactylus gundi]